MRRKHSEWELHPDFEAKRFFKYRESADWVLQIYSDDSTEQHRSRTALQSLEKFLDSDLDRIKKKQLIQLFGWSAGEGYDRLQIPRTIKSEVSNCCSSDLNHLLILLAGTRDRGPHSNTIEEWNETKESGC